MIPINIDEEIVHVDNVMNVLNDADFRVMDWKNDPGGRSRRLYEWWRSMMNGHNTQLPAFATAVRLIVTLQCSSAASERVFSQLNFIRRVVGDRIIEDLLELR